LQFLPRFLARPCSVVAFAATNGTFEVLISHTIELIYSAILKKQREHGASKNQVIWATFWFIAIISVYLYTRTVYDLQTCSVGAITSFSGGTQLTKSLVTANTASLGILNNSRNLVSSKFAFLNI
jgi:hypothetical protein